MISSGGTRARPARYFPRVPRNDASAPPVLSFFPRRSRGSSEREEPSWFVKFKTISKILLNFSFSFFREIWIECFSQIELSNYWIFLYLFSLYMNFFECFLNALKNIIIWKNMIIQLSSHNKLNICILK